MIKELKKSLGLKKMTFTIAIYRKFTYLKYLQKMKRR